MSAVTDEPGPGDWVEHADRLAAAAIADGEPTAWFDRLYAAGRAGTVRMPWDRTEPQVQLAQWTAARRPDGAGRRALVVGCGLGADAEHVATLGFDTVAFDISATAIGIAMARFPGSAVEYVTADLLAPPAQWMRAFDLVVETYTVQALPSPPRDRAIATVARLVAPGGTLLVIANAHDEHADPEPGPPWPLTRAEIDAFATDGLVPVRVEAVPVADHPTRRRWLAEFTR